MRRNIARASGPRWRALYGMTDLPTVTAVVPGSAGDAAGIGPGDAIVAIDGAGAAADLPAVHGRSRRRASLHRDDRSARRGVRGGSGDADGSAEAGAERTVTVTGAAACRSAVQLDLSQRAQRERGRT